MSDFQEAGIRVWMLTGDKGETAAHIGKNCGFYTDDYVIFDISEHEERVGDRLVEIINLTTKVDRFVLTLCGA